MKASILGASAPHKSKGRLDLTISRPLFCIWPLPFFHTGDYHPASDMTTEMSTIGGARIGWVNATWPLAKLTASAARLRISGVIGTYEFRSSEVVSLERFGSIPLFSSGVRIIHSRPDYPYKIVFWCLGSPEVLIEEIRQAGFFPTAPASSEAKWHGIPLRWSAILFLLVAWNGLIYLSGFLAPRVRLPAELFALIPLLLTFLMSWRLKTSAELQKLILSEGHSVGEIKAYLNLLQVVTGLLLVIFTIIVVATLSH
jgi:hypothetical protein